MYSELRKQFPLQSLTMAKNTDDEDLHARVFGQLEEKACTIIRDEIYVKASISFTGGVLFGYAVDDPTKKAITLLAIIMKCVFGGLSLFPVLDLKLTFSSSVSRKFCCR